MDPRHVLVLWDIRKGLSSLSVAEADDKDGPAQQVIFKLQLGPPPSRLNVIEQSKVQDQIRSGNQTYSETRPWPPW